MFENFHPGIIFILIGFLAALCAAKERRMILACCPVLALFGLLNIAPGTDLEFKFLEDFTLANERHISEVALWNDYLVYATLFGIGKQVMKDMKQLNPEFLEMNEITRNLTNEDLVPSLMTAAYIGSRDVTSAVNSRNSGGGGSSSFGGGGGFSGGGSGGGVR